MEINGSIETYRLVISGAIRGRLGLGTRNSWKRITTHTDLMNA